MNRGAEMRFCRVELFRKVISIASLSAYKSDCITRLSLTSYRNKKLLFAASSLEYSFHMADHLSLFLVGYTVLFELH